MSPHSTRRGRTAHRRSSLVPPSRPPRRAGAARRQAFRQRGMCVGPTPARDLAAGAGVGFAHTSMYPCPHILTEQYDVFTNAGPCAAWRAPGQVQGIFALEQSLDELAERLGMDPLALPDAIDTTGTDDAKARCVERRIGAEK